MANEGMAAAASALSILWAETIMRQLWGIAQERLGLKSDKVQTSPKSPLSVTPSMLLCVLTWSWSSLGANTFILRSKEKDTINWKRPIDMCSILWVCCFLSRWYFKENDNFLSFRPSLTLSFKNVNAASFQFHVLARKLEKTQIAKSRWSCCWPIFTVSSHVSTGSTKYSGLDKNFLLKKRSHPLTNIWAYWP